MLERLKQDAEALWRRDVRLTEGEKARGLDELHRRVGVGVGAARPAWIFGGIVVATAAVVLVFWPRAQLFQPMGDTTCLRADSSSVFLPETCAAPVRISVRQDEVELLPGTLLVEGEGTLRLERGQARFLIEPRRSAKDTFRLRVSAGTVVVHGTEFMVIERGGQGSIALASGEVTFEWDDGTSETMSPGQTLRWGEDLEPAAPHDAALEPARRDTAEDVASGPRFTPAQEHPARSRPHDTPAARLTIDEVMARQFQLRAQGRHDETLGLLRKASLEQRFTAAQRERLSYEFGRLLEQLQRSNDACAHWTAHERRFARGAYATAVREKRRACQP